eukprot:GHVT01062208.1.p1 GENE.GHVT01062208.1~~GHVT01062208.1.p1  ORF type:complete len:112 (-),score=4.80 GHVT01062208.1:402-737(-)
MCDAFKIKDQSHRRRMEFERDSHRRHKIILEILRVLYDLMGPTCRHEIDGERTGYGLTTSKNLYDTSGTFNSALKAPDAPYDDDEKTPRRLHDSHSTLAAAVRFCTLSQTF